MPLCCRTTVSKGMLYTCHAGITVRLQCHGGGEAFPRGRVGGRVSTSPSHPPPRLLSRRASAVSTLPNRETMTCLRLAPLPMHHFARPSDGHAALHSPGSVQRGVVSTVWGKSDGICHSPHRRGELCCGRWHPRTRASHPDGGDCPPSRRRRPRIRGVGGTRPRPHRDR